MKNELERRMELTWMDGGGSLVTRDFHRFSYLHVPGKAVIQAGEIIRRDGGLKFARAIFDLFRHEGWTGPTKNTTYNAFVAYVTYCDGAGVDPRSEEGLNYWYDHLEHEHLLGKWKDSSCNGAVSRVKAVLGRLGFPVEDWLDGRGEFGTTQTVHVPAYSATDVRKLLSLITRMFDQLYDQFIARPQYYIQRPNWRPNLEEYAMNFTRKKTTFTVYAPITKLACLSAHILAYYTWGNTSQLYRLKRPNLSEEKWAEMTVYKPRAHKFVTLEIGENDSLHTECHGLKYLKKILDISKRIDPAPDARLLNAIQGGRSVPLNSGTLKTFNRWIQKKFDLRDDFDRPLLPTVQRFRSTGIFRFEACTGSTLAPAIISQDTPRVLDGHYRTGSEFENDRQIQATCHTLEYAARRRKGIQDAKEETKKLMKLEELPYEAFLKQLARPGHVDGSQCPQGERPTAQNWREMEHKILRNDGRLACAGLLEYFNFRDQGKIESLEELWRMLSFRQCLEESAYRQLSQDQFENTFGNILLCIDKRLAQLGDQRMLDRAKLKLIDEGRHPQWLDSGNIRITVEKVDEN